MEKYKATEEKVFSFIERHHIFEPGDIVVVGVSGGADSVCLLFVLLEIKKRIPLTLHVVHVNHGIRAEAEDDAVYVKALCTEHNLPFHLVSENVRELAKLQHKSEEEMGRIVRYRAFADIAGEVGAAKIAVAHNMNDKCETMMLNLFRGSGISGLGSIRPVRDNIVRPILCLERAEIEEYLNERGIKFCTDATNFEDDYTRNRIRHHILTYAEEEISAKAVVHVAKAADNLREIDDYLGMQAEALKGECVIQNEKGYVFDIDAMLKGHPVIIKRLLYELIMELTPHKKDITESHVAAVMNLLTKEGNYMTSLPFGIEGRKEYSRLYLYKKEDKTEKISEECALKLDILPYNAEKYGKVPQNKYTKWFDYDKIETSLTVRTRREGDYISVSDGKGGVAHKSLKSYFINEKIAAAKRDSILLLADDDHIIWVVGYRISEKYKVSENTKRILQVQLVKGCEGE